MASYVCARCHKLFERVAFETVCPECFPIEEREFAKIKEYLTVHPGASSNEVMTALDVSLKSIKRYLREDRLEIVGDNKGFIRCELCGRPINSGRFCDACYKEGMAKLQKEAGMGITAAYINSGGKPNTKTSKGIRYYEKDDK